MDELHLREVQLPDLRYLADAPDSVRELALWYCRSLTSLAGLESQAGSLTKLNLMHDWGTGHDIPLEGLDSLEALTALRVDESTWQFEADIRAITRLPRLRRLQLGFPGRVPREVPSWVRDIPHLTDLYVWHVKGRLDLRHLAGAENLTVHVKRWTRVVGADLLGPGSSLVTVARDASLGW